MKSSYCLSLLPIVICVYLTFKIDFYQEHIDLIWATFWTDWNLLNQKTAGLLFFFLNKRQY